MNFKTILFLFFTVVMVIVMFASISEMISGEGNNFVFGLIAMVLSYLATPYFFGMSASFGSDGIYFDGEQYCEILAYWTLIVLAVLLVMAIVAVLPSLL